MKTCHLVLTYENYFKIRAGAKVTEYRRDCPYWEKRLLNADSVTFHRGYSSTTMTFRILSMITIGGEIEIHLGRRLK